MENSNNLGQVKISNDVIVTIAGLAALEVEGVETITSLTDKLLKNNGRIALVHRTERFVEILNTMQKYNIEPKRVRFIYSKENKNSNLVLIEGIKNGKPGLKLLPPLIIYDADGNYTKEVSLMFGEWLYVTK